MTDWVTLGKSTMKAGNKAGLNAQHGLCFACGHEVKLEDSGTVVLNPEGKKKQKVITCAKVAKGLNSQDPALVMLATMMGSLTGSCVEAAVADPKTLIANYPDVIKTYGAGMAKMKERMSVLEGAVQEMAEAQDRANREGL